MAANEKRMAVRGGNEPNNNLMKNEKSITGELSAEGQTSHGDHTRLADAADETQRRYCPDCQKTTLQTVRLYNPDDFEDGEVWECNHCKNNTGWAS